MIIIAVAIVMLIIIMISIININNLFFSRVKNGLHTKSNRSLDASLGVQRSGLHLSEHSGHGSMVKDDVRLGLK